MCRVKIMSGRHPPNNSQEKQLLYCMCWPAGPEPWPCRGLHSVGWSVSTFFAIFEKPPRVRQNFYLKKIIETLQINFFVVENLQNPSSYIKEQSPKKSKLKMLKYFYFIFQKWPKATLKCDILDLGSYNNLAKPGKCQFFSFKNHSSPAYCICMCSRKQKIFPQPEEERSNQSSEKKSKWEVRSTYTTVNNPPREN